MFSASARSRKSSATTSTMLPISSSADTSGPPDRRSGDYGSLVRQWQLIEVDHVSTGTIRYPGSRQRQERQAVGLAHGAIRAANRRRRAPLDRRLLPQHRLSAQQE